MSKKAKLIKAIAILIQVIPLLVVLGIYSPVLVSRWDKALSISAIIVIILLCMIFKDATKKILQRPSGFLFSGIIFGLCLVMSSVGEQMLVISATSLISGLVALPFNVWFNSLTRPITREDLKKVGDNNVKEI